MITFGYELWPRFDGAVRCEGLQINVVLGPGVQHHLWRVQVVSRPAVCCPLAGALLPRPLGAIRSRSTLWFYSLHHRGIVIQGSGFYFWILPGVLVVHLLWLFCARLLIHIFAYRSGPAQKACTDKSHDPYLVATNIAVSQIDR